MTAKLSHFFKEECFRVENDNLEIRIDSGFMFALAFWPTILAIVLTFII